MDIPQDTLSATRLAFARECRVQAKLYEAKANKHKLAAKRLEFATIALVYNETAALVEARDAAMTALPFNGEDE